MIAARAGSEGRGEVRGKHPLRARHRVRRERLGTPEDHMECGKAVPRIVRLHELLRALDVDRVPLLPPESREAHEVPSLLVVRRSPDAVAVLRAPREEQRLPRVLPQYRHGLPRAHDVRGRVRPAEQAEPGDGGGKRYVLSLDGPAPANPFVALREMDVVVPSADRPATKRTALA